MRNKLIPSDLLKMTMKEAVDLPIDQLANLQIDIEEQDAELKHIKKFFDAILQEKFTTRLTACYKGRDEPFGKVVYNEDGFLVNATTSKIVAWSQDRLNATAKTLENEWGEDASEYITSKLSVSETKFKAWPEKIKKLFISARTVKPGKVNIKLTQAGEE